MEVSIVTKTDNAEEVVCRAARGDYMPTTKTEYGTNWVENSVSFEQVMDGVDGSSIEEQKDNLIKQLLQRGHYGPFEHVSITFSIKGISRVTMAQITRHRHLSFDVQSMRYVDFSEGSEIAIPKSLTDTDHFSRETGLVEAEDDVRKELLEKYENFAEESISFYEEMVDAGIPKEDARFALPLGTEVNMTMTGNARTMLHILDMRRKADAQWEARELSNEILQELMLWMPTTFEYYKENGPNKLSP